MKYIINYSKENFKKDYKNYLFFHRKKQWYPILGLLIFSGIILLVSFWVTFEFDIKGIAFALTILGTVLLLFELFYRYFALKSIHQTASKFKSGSEYVIIESNQIKLTYEKINYESIFYSQIKKCLILNNVLFIIFKSEKDWPVRINKSEINKDGFPEVIKYLEKKNIPIEYKE